jgi:hypothetical protein
MLGIVYAYTVSDTLYQTASKYCMLCKGVAFRIPAHEVEARCHRKLWLTLQQCIM